MPCVSSILIRQWSGCKVLLFAPARHVGDRGMAALWTYVDSHEAAEAWSLWGLVQGSCVIL